MGSKFNLGFLLFLSVCACIRNPDASSEAAALSGEKALEHVHAQVALGSRPPGSPQLQDRREYTVPGRENSQCRYY
jgi:hypothetical protein